MSEWDFDAAQPVTREMIEAGIARCDARIAAAQIIADLLDAANLRGLAQAVRDFGGGWISVALKRLERPGWARCSPRRLTMHNLDLRLWDELRRELARRLDQEDKVMLALTIGCGAFALGMHHVEPLHDVAGLEVAEDDAR